jgi:hypothetical protein
MKDCVICGEDGHNNQEFYAFDGDAQPQIHQRKRAASLQPFKQFGNAELSL